MLNYFKAFSVFLFWVLIALSSHYYITSKHFNNCNLDTTIITTTPKNILVFDTNEAGSSNYNFRKGFTINKHNANVSSILSIPSLKDSINSILDSDYSKELHIIGKYLAIEINSKFDGNTGLKRAQIVKNELISLGIQSSRIKTFGKIFNFSYNKKGRYSNGIEMKFKKMKLHFLDSLEYRIANKILYVDFKNDSLIHIEKLADYTQILKQYLQKYADKKVLIIGHTDNLGYYDKNLIIGLNKAIRVKEYFVNNGIEDHRIATVSKGESEPIAEKITKEGRAKNRRVVIKIN